MKETKTGSRSSDKEAQADTTHKIRYGLRSLYISFSSPCKCIPSHSTSFGKPFLRKILFLGVYGCAPFNSGQLCFGAEVGQPSASDALQCSPLRRRSGSIIEEHVT
jgi:hypothetical protein